jgi:ABC-type polysaccharide/polyol phosphate export permease
VYSIIFGSDPKIFIPTLFAGLNPWLFMSGTADGATMSFLGAEGYIKQSTVAAQIFPLRITTVNFVNLLYNVLAFFAVYLFLQPDCFGPIMLMCIPGLVIMFLFVLGLANINSVIMLSIRDFEPLLSLIFQGLFYATPIIFSATILADKGFSLIYEINPFYYMLEVVRQPMLGESLPDIKTYVIAIVLTLFTSITGIFVVMRAKKTIAFKL